MTLGGLRSPRSLGVGTQNLDSRGPGLILGPGGLLLELVGFSDEGSSAKSRNNQIRKSMFDFFPYDINRCITPKQKKVKL